MEIQKFEKYEDIVNQAILLTTQFMIDTLSNDPKGSITEEARDAVLEGLHMVGVTGDAREEHYSQRLALSARLLDLPTHTL